MDNKEKRKYISDLIYANSGLNSQLFSTRALFKFLNPTKLYKYRKFDKWSFEAFDKDYIYFSSIEELDDPFEFAGDFDKKKLLKQTQKIDFSKEIDLIFKDLPDNLKENKEEIKSFVLGCLREDGTIDEMKFITTAKPEYYCDRNFSKAFEIIKTCNAIMTRMAENDAVLEYINISDKGQEKTGIFSMAEENDNRIMWSLYSKNYTGYCIEYDFTDSEYLPLLLPVVYERKRNDVLRNTIRLNRNIMFKNSTMNLIDADCSSGLIQFVSKDACWKSQKEWRIIGNPSTYCQSPKVTAVYLGYKVSDRNKLRMIKYAKKFKFKLYQMNINPRKNKLSFKEII